jgi:hypothetical protein
VGERVHEVGHEAAVVKKSKPSVHALPVGVIGVKVPPPIRAERYARQQRPSKQEAVYYLRMLSLSDALSEGWRVRVSLIADCIEQVDGKGWRKGAALSMPQQQEIEMYALAVDLRDAGVSVKDALDATARTYARVHHLGADDEERMRDRIAEVRRQQHRRRRRRNEAGN